MKHVSGFRIITTAVMVVLIGIIVAMFVADIFFVDAQSMREVVTSSEIRYAFFLSLTTSLITTALAVIVAVPSAYALSRFPFKGIVFFDIVVDLLIVIPVLVIGVSVLVFFRMGRELAESSFFLTRAVGEVISSLGSFFTYRRPGIVLAQFLCSVSFSVRAIKASLDSIDPRTEHVALTLGCNRAMAFWRISLPLARQGIVAGAVLTWARAYGIFGAISIVAGAVRRKTEVLPTSVYLEISIGRLEIALGISLLMVGVAFIILLLLRVFSGGNVFSFGRDT